jgi:hypothetical protein
MSKYTIIKNLTLSAAIAFTAVGCVSNQDSSSLSEKDKKIAQLQKQLKNVNSGESELTSLKEKLQQTQKEKDEITNKYHASLETSLVPANAVAGECYAKVRYPATYETVNERRLISEETTKIDVLPAVYEVVDKKVVVRGETTKLKVIPAVYKKVTKEVLATPEKIKLVQVPTTYKLVEETIMVEPEKTKLINIPATYKTVKEKILIAKSYTKWKKGRGEIEKINNKTGDIMCLITVPAVHKTVTKTVVDVPAHKKEVKTPAIYKTITSSIIDVPAHTKEVKTPATYQTVTTVELVTPAKTEEIKSPAICKMVKTKVLVSPATQKVTVIPAVYKNYTVEMKKTSSYLRWQTILCKTNTKPGIVAKLQKALKAKGYKVGAVNGKYNKATKMAVNKYQGDNQLSQGALTLKTLETLGLK